MLSQTKFNVGDVVKIRKRIKNDGTFPGLPWDEVIVNKGEIGVVVDIGIFLLTKTVYTIFFPRLDIFVGCIEQELEAMNVEKTSSL